MSRKRRVTVALDQCLVRLAHGDSLSQCLYDYPQLTEELLPLLEVAIGLRRLPRPEQRLEAVDAGHERMMAALRAESRGRAVPLSRRGSRSRVPSGRTLPSWWMGAVGVFAALVLLASSLVLLLQSGGYLRLTSRPAEVVVSEAVGGVLRLPKGDRTWVLAKAGDRLRVGDRLQTASDGRVSLSLAGQYGASLMASAEIAVLALPDLRQPSDSLVLYQEEGDVYYAEPLVSNVEVSSDRIPEARMAFEVHTPLASARADRVGFAMAVTVAQDGATAVSVDKGEISIVAGKWALVTNAGEMTVVTATDEAPVTYRKGELPPGRGWGLGLQEDRQLPFGPPWEDHLPPGQVDRDHRPPGLEDDDASPDHHPPGLEDKGGVPPGQLDKDDEHSPPGLDDKEGIPPGQLDKDKDAEDESDTDSGVVLETTLDVDASSTLDPESAPDVGDAPDHQPPGLESNGSLPPGQQDTRPLPPGQEK